MLVLVMIISMKVYKNWKLNMPWFKKNILNAW